MVFFIEKGEMVIEFDTFKPEIGYKEWSLVRIAWIALYKHYFRIGSFPVFGSLSSEILATSSMSCLFCKSFFSQSILEKRYKWDITILIAATNQKVQKHFWKAWKTVSIPCGQIINPSEDRGKEFSKLLLIKHFLLVTTGVMTGYTGLIYSMCSNLCLFYHILFLSSKIPCYYQVIFSLSST